MAAVNPQGDDLYWIDDQPAMGMSRASIDLSNDLYWIDAQPIRLLIPNESVNTSLFFQFFGGF